MTEDVDEADENGLKVDQKDVTNLLSSKQNLKPKIKKKPNSSTRVLQPTKRSSGRDVLQPPKRSSGRDSGLLRGKTRKVFIQPAVVQEDDKAQSALLKKTGDNLGV